VTLLYYYRPHRYGSAQIAVPFDDPQFVLKFSGRRYVFLSEGDYAPPAPAQTREVRLAARDRSQPVPAAARKYRLKL
jgi:hypothetical protein